MVQKKRLHRRAQLSMCGRLDLHGQCLGGLAAFRPLPQAATMLSILIPPRPPLRRLTACPATPMHDTHQCSQALRGLDDVRKRQGLFLAGKVVVWREEQHAMTLLHV